MTQAVGKITSVIAATHYTPGYLLAPFGWAADAVGAMVATEPTLLFHLFGLDRARMHLIGLALAYMKEFSPDIGIFLVSGSVRAVTERILGRSRPGIKRVLSKLPSEVMPPENYRLLVELLANPDAAKLLHHARSIDGAKIKALHGIPAPLRNIFIGRALEYLSGTNSLSDNLNLLVARGAAPSYDALVQELTAITQPGQLFAKIREIVEALPLPPPLLPPVQVGEAQRLDQAVAIRALAKSWQNCLVSYLDGIDAGTCAVYLWQDSHATAACSVRRYGRLGWFLEQVKGPQNVDIEPEHLAKIQSAFNDVGIPDCSVIAAINCMIHEADIDESHLRRVERRQRANAGPLDPEFPEGVVF